MKIHSDQQTVTRRVIDAGIEWYNDLFIRSGHNPRLEPFIVVPTRQMVDSAIAANNPVIALGNYEHYYSVTLFNDYCRSVGMTRADHNRIVVAEIGTAHGILASMMISKYPEVNYIFIDIPERLRAIAPVLRTDFSDARCLFAEDHNEVANANLDRWRMIFVPCEFAGALAGKHVDLVWTFHGMNALDNSSSAEYFNLVQSRLRPRTFIFRNRYLNLINDADLSARANANMSAVLADEQWTIRGWSLEPSIVGSPYVDAGRHVRYLETVLQRLVKPDDGDARIAAKRTYLEGVAVQAWVDILRHPNAHAHAWGFRPIHFMTDRTGTLGKLWDHLRLAPGRDVLLILLHYLDYCRLGSNRLFEEWLFYAAVLKELHRTAPDAASAVVLNWISERVQEGANSSGRPVPNWRLGYETLPEPLSIAEVRKIMVGIDVRRSLGVA
jgi:hypothetical protein